MPMRRRRENSAIINVLRARHQVYLKLAQIWLRSFNGAAPCDYSPIDLCYGVCVASLRGAKLNRSSVILRVLASFAILLPASIGWTQVPENTYQELHWRMIGPFRGGRTRAAAGVPSQPNLFYMAQVNGGVWKSDDYGRTWTPIFDHEPTQSIGAIAVAASDPNIVYVSDRKSTRL